MNDEIQRRILETLQRMEARQLVIEARLQGIEDIQNMILGDLEFHGLLKGGAGDEPVDAPLDLQAIFLPAPKRAD